MNRIDPELERRLAALRSDAEPTLADQRRVLEGVRYALDATSAAGLARSASVPRPAPSLGGDPLPARGPRAHRSRDPWLRRRSLRVWLSGAAVGGGMGLAIGMGLGDAFDTATPAFDAASRGEVSAAPLDGRAYSAREASGSGNTPSGAAEALPAEALPAEAPAAPSALTTARATARHAHESVSRRRRQAADQQRANEPAERPRRPELSLAEALELLHRAERSLHAREPELALGFLSDLDRRAARGVLREERLATLALALCALERHDAARAAQRELATENSNSIYLARLRHGCADGAPPARSRTPER